MPDDVMGNEELSGCLVRIVYVRDSPIQEYGRAKVSGVGFEVLGLEVFELAEEAHGSGSRCSMTFACSTDFTMARNSAI